ncbi:MAG: DUF1887 family protein [Acidobacteria bacterium]|nr:DUF1887 family protein [Acidobacteriota bacterium]
MPENPIPSDLRCDHLFLLVGTNPLPDWVAAKLLLRDGGKLWLVHSQTTNEVAIRLANYSTQNKLCQPQFVPVANPWDFDSVRTALEAVLDSQQFDSVGLNYTGGTKVMSVHAHRVFANRFPQKAILSYLEAPYCLMHFEPVEPGYPRGYKIPVGTLDAVKFDFKELARLHEDFQRIHPKDKVKAWAIAEMVRDVHQTFNGQLAWRKDCDAYLRRRENRNKFKSPAELQTQPIPCAHSFPRLAEALLRRPATGTNTLLDVVNASDGQFRNVTELAEWLDGKWLEHLVLGLLLEHQETYGIHSIGSNIEPSLESEEDSKRYKIQFEIDVAAMRGYQLHAISCYSGSTEATCKLKLFEVFTRARQLGGDEARAALVCNVDDARKVEKQAGEVWDIKDRVKVFGRADLKNLGDRLKDWFVQ